MDACEADLVDLATSIYKFRSFETEGMRQIGTAGGGEAMGRGTLNEMAGGGKG